MEHSPAPTYSPGPQPYFQPQIPQQTGYTQAPDGTYHAAPQPTNPYENFVSPGSPNPNQQPPQVIHSNPGPVPIQGYAEKSPIPVVRSVPVQQGQPIQPGQVRQPNAFLTATPLNSLGLASAPVDCPVCGQRYLTRDVRKSGNTNHAWALGLFLTTLHCCFIPYLITSLKDVQHYCGGCGVLLATSHKSGRVEVHQFPRAQG